MSALLVGTGVSVGLQLLGSYLSSQNIREAAKVRKRISEINSEFAELDAYDAEIAGFSQVAEYQVTVDQTLSNQRLAFTSQDVDVNFGSAAELQQETRLVAELNRMEIVKRANERALGLEQQSRDILLQGGINQNDANRKASQTLTLGLLNAGVTGATGYARS